jgi:hypothetical protein
LRIKAEFDTEGGAPWTFIVIEAAGIWTDGTNTYLGLDYVGDIYTTVAVDQTLTSADTGKTYLNSSADVILMLPTSPAPGARYLAQVVAAHHIKFLAGGSNLIYNGTLASTAGGYIDSNAIGSTIELRWNGTFWATPAINGPWSLA